MANVKHSESKLASFARAAHINKDAEQWLLNCIDPCHDRLTKLEGYPDDNQSASVVQRVKQAYTIKAPANITGTALWDLQIVNTPFLTNIPAVSSLLTPISNVAGVRVLSSNQLTQDLSFTATVAYGGLMFQAVPSAAGFDLITISTAQAAGTGYSIANNLPSIYTQGPSRVIANAFEACNTTAELTVQGSVACYRQPVQDFECATTMNWISTSSSSSTEALSLCPASFLPVPAPPNDLAQAMLLPGTKQWKAKEGVYVVSALNTDLLEAQSTNFVQPLIQYNPSDQTDPQLYSPLPFNTGVAIGTSGCAITAFKPQYWTNFDQSGCIWTGLSANTTIQVTWVVDVERFPSEQQGDLVVIATPSTVYCPAAIEAYSMMIQDMPVGVTFAENGLGDWFMDAVSSVRDVIVPVLRPMAKNNPMLNSILSVHDLVTGKGKKKGQQKTNKSRSDGKGFMSTGSGANQGKVYPNGKGQAWRAKK